MRSGSPRIVVDTNVLISGTISLHGASAHIVDAVRAGKITLIISPLLLTEFDSVIHRARIVRRYPVTAAGADDFLEYLKVQGYWVAGIPQTAFVSADPKDDMVLSCALDGDADYIVSGDRHLTELKEFEGIPILTPAEFVRRFKL